MSDSATEVTFDMAKKRIRVHSKRPWFVPAWSFGFLDIAPIRAVNRSAENVDSWEGKLASSFTMEQRSGWGGKARAGAKSSEVTWRKFVALQV